MLTFNIPFVILAHMAKQQDDHFTEPGAQRLADTIVSYWRSRGYLGIVAKIYPLPGQTGLCYGVRSNIWPNGYPPIRAKRQC